MHAKNLKIAFSQVTSNSAEMLTCFCFESTVLGRYNSMFFAFIVAQEREPATALKCSRVSEAFYFDGLTEKSKIC